MSFKFYFKVMGGHTHIRVFAGPHPDYTHGKCGDLVMTNEEWQAFKNVSQYNTCMQFIVETGDAKV